MPYEIQEADPAFQPEGHSGVEESQGSQDGDLRRGLAASFGSKGDGDVAETELDDMSPKEPLKMHVKSILAWRGHNEDEAARFATPSPAKDTAEPGERPDQPEEADRKVHPEFEPEHEGEIEDSDKGSMADEDAGLPRDQAKPGASMESVVEAQTQAHMLSTLIYMHEQGLDLAGAISNLKNLVGANIDTYFDCSGPAAPIVTRIKQFESKRRDRPVSLMSPKVKQLNPKEKAKAPVRAVVGAVVAVVAVVVAAAVARLLQLKLLSLIKMNRMNSQQRR